MFYRSCSPHCPYSQIDLYIENTLNTIILELISSKYLVILTNFFFMVLELLVVISFRSTKDPFFVKFFF